MKMGAQELTELQMMMEEGHLDDFESEEPVFEKTIKTKKHRNPDSTNSEESLYHGNV